jgi:hypothetical protein
MRTGNLRRGLSGARSPAFRPLALQIDHAASARSRSCFGLFPVRRLAVRRIELAPDDK